MHIIINCKSFCLHFLLLFLDDRSVRDSERRAAIMHFTSDQVLLLTDTPCMYLYIPVITTEFVNTGTSCVPFFSVLEHKNLCYFSISSVRLN